MDLRFVHLALSTLRYRSRGLRSRSIRLHNFGSTNEKRGGNVVVVMNASEPSVSIRLSQEVIVSAVIKNVRAVSAIDHPRAARSSRIAIRSQAA
jgi:hypothetical protein